MDYNETQQKRILRKMERDLLAIVAVDMETDDFEVIYSDGAYRDYGNRHQGEDFFSSWAKNGIPLVFDEDRERMQQALRAACAIASAQREDGSIR